MPDLDQTARDHAGDSGRDLRLALALPGAPGAQDDAVGQARVFAEVLAHFVADQLPLSRGKGRTQVRIGSSPP
jgi:hypothetical protein